ncbi:MAG: hypothetical protein AAFQ81_16285 [Pseudomonadota bacterium]
MRGDTPAFGRLIAAAVVVAGLLTGPAAAATRDQGREGSGAEAQLATVGGALSLALDLCIAFRRKPADAVGLARGLGFEPMTNRSAYARALGLATAGSDAAALHDATRLAEGYFALPAAPGAVTPARATLAVTIDRGAASCLMTSRIDTAPRNLSSVARLGAEVLEAKGVRSTCFDADGGPPLRILRGWGGGVSARGCEQPAELAAAQCCWFEISYRETPPGAQLNTLIHLAGGKR